MRVLYSIQFNTIVFFLGTAYDMSKTSGFGQTPVFGGAATFGSTTPSQYTFGQNSNSAECMYIIIVTFLLSYNLYFY